MTITIYREGDGSILGSAYRTKRSGENAYHVAAIPDEKIRKGAVKKGKDMI